MSLRLIVFPQISHGKVAMWGFHLPLGFFFAEVGKIEFAPIGMGGRIWRAGFGKLLAAFVGWKRGFALAGWSEVELGNKACFPLE